MDNLWNYVLPHYVGLRDNSGILQFVINKQQIDSFMHNR